MTDKLVSQSLKLSVAALCQKIGWDSVHESSLDVLADIWKRKILLIAKKCHRITEHYGRTLSNYDDIAFTFHELSMPVSEIEDYCANFEPVPFPYLFPNFPIKKNSELNFLRPGSAEVLTRPVHIHEYMPPWEVEEGQSNGVKEPPKSEVSKEVVKEVVKVKIEPEEVVIEEENAEEKDKKNLEEEDDGMFPSSSSLPFTSFSASRRNNEQVSENPALKRMRMLMEEEGHPLREISSVMMTTSGFLSSSREGRLPESRPPPNRDFFEPEPIVEKKKKVPTNMKKIVEGVKKIEKENLDEEANEILPPVKVEKEKKNKDKSKKRAHEIEESPKAEKLKIFKKSLTKNSTPSFSTHKKEKEVSEGELSSSDDSLPPDFFTKDEDKVKKKSKTKEEKKDKKKEKEKLLFSPPSIVPIPKTSPTIPPPLPPPSISTEPLDSPPKKKETRGRKRKNFNMIRPQLPENPFGDDFVPIYTKAPKKLKLDPQISPAKHEPAKIHEPKPLPPPPSLTPFVAMPSGPGLIPNLSNFGPPPPLKLGGSLSTSTLSITPQSKESKKASPNLSSSVTITRIDMPTPKLPVFEPPVVEKSQVHVVADSSSGITITPILMTGGKEDESREERRREKEKRKELKKEKKKKKEKLREKRKEKEKKKSKEEPTIPKLTLKLNSSVGESGGSNRSSSERVIVPVQPKKITFKSLEEKIRKRSRTPEPPPLPTLTPKPKKITKIPTPKPSPPVIVTPPPPPPPPPVIKEKLSSSSNKKEKELKKSGRSKSSSKSSSGGTGTSSQSGLITETVGFYIDEQGTKIWICPAVGCGREDDGSPMIGCDGCDDWYHFLCVGIEKEPEPDDQWFCPRCVKKGAKKGR